MKVKNKLIKTLFSVCIMLIFGYLTYSQAYFYLNRQNPFSDRVKFKYIYYATMDDEKNVYRIDRAKRRITKTSPDGKVEFEITTKPDTINRKSYFSGLTVGDNDNIYVKKVTTTTSLYSATKDTREEIIEYNTKDFFPSGKLIYEHSNDGKEECIFNISYQNGYLCFVRGEDPKETQKVVNPYDPQKIKLYRVLSKDYNLKQYKSFSFSKHYYINRMFGVYPNELYFTSKKAKYIKHYINNQMFKNCIPYLKKCL